MITIIIIIIIIIIFITVYVFYSVCVWSIESRSSGLWCREMLR